MLKAEIAELNTRATDFLTRVLAMAAEAELKIITLDIGQFVFIDTASGIQASCNLVEKSADSDSVASKAEVGQPGILMGPPPGKLN